MARDKTNPQILNNLGVYFFEKGREDEAISYLEKAVKLLPKDPVIYLNLKRVYVSNGLINKAIELLEEASGYYQEEFRFYYALYELYQGEKENELAARALENYLLYCTEEIDRDEIKIKIDSLRKEPV